METSPLLVFAFIVLLFLPTFGLICYWVRWLEKDNIRRQKYLCENLGDESWYERCKVCGQLEQRGSCPNDAEQWHRTYRKAA